MTRFKPSPNQQNLPFDASTQYALIKQVRVGSLRPLLNWLFIVIGGKPSWVLGVNEIIADGEMGRTYVYEGLKTLKEMALIHWETLPDRRRRFYICWPNLAEMVDEQMGAGGGVRSVQRAIAVRSADETVRHTDGESATRIENPPGGLRIRHTGESVRQADDIYRNHHATHPNSPPSSPSESADAELMLMLVTAGIGQPGECLRRALEQGMTSDDVRAVLEHYNAPANAQRWPAEVLFNRLTRPGAASLKPDQGWFGESAEWKAAQSQRQAKAATQTPEIRWGPTLDALTAEELQELVSDVPVKEQRWVKHRLDWNQSHGEPLTDPELRRLLLIGLMRRSQRENSS